MAKYIAQHRRGTTKQWYEAQDIIPLEGEIVIEIDDKNFLHKLKIGDEVIMNDRYRVSEKNKGKVFVVRSEPFEICGTECVLLEDYRGGYAMDGLTKVVER